MPTQHSTEEEATQEQGIVVPLELDGLRILKQEVQPDGTLRIEVMGTNERASCPHCQNVCVKRHDVRPRSKRDAPLKEDLRSWYATASASGLDAWIARVKGDGPAELRQALSAFRNWRDPRLAQRGCCRANVDLRSKRGSEPDAQPTRTGRSSRMEREQGRREQELRTGQENRLRGSRGAASLSEKKGCQDGVKPSLIRGRQQSFLGYRTA